MWGGGRKPLPVFRSRGCVLSSLFNSCIALLFYLYLVDSELRGLFLPNKLIFNRRLVLGDSSWIGVRYKVWVKCI